MAREEEARKKTQRDSEEAARRVTEGARKLLADRKEREARRKVRGCDARLFVCSITNNVVFGLTSF